MPDRFLSRRDFLKLTLKSSLGTLGFGLAVYGYGRAIETQWLDFERLTLTLPRLNPIYNGYRIVHLSDIHVGSFMSPNHLAHIVELVNREKADLVAMTGDFVKAETTSKDLTALATSLKQLAPRDAVMAVLGNHDYWYGTDIVRKTLRDGGAMDLSNDIFTLHRGRNMLHIAGVGDAWTKNDDLDLVLDRLPQDGPAILLSHTPYNADSVAAAGRFDLQLSGHTHGRNIVVPLYGRLWHGHKYDAGRYQVGSMILYVNRGVGISGPFVRLNCRPEITVLTLMATT